MKESRVDILMVDDREDGLIALEAVLGGQGYNLIKAQSGREALGLLGLYEFAMVLMDVQMPELDGFETATLIRRQAQYRHVPILFITAINKDESYVHRGYELGAADYLFKPFDPHILRAKVAVFVDLFKKTRQIREQAHLISQIKERERQHERTRLELDSLRRYQALADAIPHIVWKTTPDGDLTYCNKGWIDYTGLNLESSARTQWHDVLHPDDLKKLLKTWLSTMSDGDRFTLECRLRRHDGETRWHWINAILERDEYGDVVGWIGTCTDIHDRKIMETKLVDSRMQAESASRAKTYFLANMSHEIRTPLNAILGFSEILSNPDLTVSERINSVATIHRNGQQLLHLIDEILDISKVEAGRLEIERKPTDLRELLADLGASLNLKAVEKDLKLVVENIGPFPRWITTDPVRLKQILINLVGNAVKFTRQGEVRVVAKWSAAAPGEEAVLRVEILDTGVGIDSRHVEKLFNPFVQADSSTTRTFGGTGLGLALSKRLASALGGDVWLETSELDRGSHFVMEVAAPPTSSTPFLDHLHQGSVKSAPDVEGAKADLDGARILLAEDAVDNQVLITRFLQMAGARVEIAKNGEEAFEKALTGDYALVLMDIQMPRMDGYEATVRLRERGYSRPIIALTAHALKEEKEKSLRVGCDDHLTKPVDRRTLLESVSLYVRRSSGGPREQRAPRDALP
ncbi:MAG: response regulator [Bdellovibrionaceae bacterium]|nr:response regulator [Pseudobdellovibrionaceae bacterium]